MENSMQAQNRPPQPKNSYSLTIKILLIGALVIILLIPSFMIQFLIHERKQRNDEAKSEISSTWGAIQTLSGPVISVPVKKTKIINRETITEYSYAHILPDELKVEGEVIPEKRHRSIYEVVVYTTNLSFSGYFNTSEFINWQLDEGQLLWDKAVISAGIPDMRGIKENIEIIWDSTKYLFNPGVPSSDIFNSGVSTEIDLSNISNQKIEFSFELSLNGSEELNFIPIGKNTVVDIKSPWPDPSFQGAFLPDEHNITQKDFTAHWKVLHLNRNFPQKWVGQNYYVESAKFGVSLIVPVDHYQKSTRSAKYAIMVIVLTFMVFFFVEVYNKNKIHPMQYLLVGLALIIFYTLLLSISEHFGFNVAYFIAAIATISLVTAYSHSIFKKISLTRIAGLILIVLYGFIFVILQLQDYALLMGSIGLFLVMAVIMYLSRKINWYNYNENKND
jgi:inner membrane protein